MEMLYTQSPHEVENMNMLVFAAKLADSQPPVGKTVPLYMKNKPVLIFALGSLVFVNSKIR